MTLTDERVETGAPVTSEGSTVDSDRVRTEARLKEAGLGVYARKLDEPVDVGSDAPVPGTVEPEKKTRSGWTDIGSGVVLMLIGFGVGDSIFLGDPGPIGILFDCLAIFWIGRGLYRLVNQTSQE